MRSQCLQDALSLSKNEAGHHAREHTFLPQSPVHPGAMLRSSERPAFLCKDRQTVSKRRRLGCVFCSLMRPLRFEPSESESADCKGMQTAR